MRIVIAIGGNALLNSKEPMNIENQRNNMRLAATQIAPIATSNELLIVHGNGPQIGLLALQNLAYQAAKPYPMDVLGAETQGMIGYLIQQELANLLATPKPISTLLTQVMVDAHDSAFEHPSKPIGPFYTREEAEQLMQQNGWHMSNNNHAFRRVVASPRPQKIVEIESIKWLLEQGAIVVCAGGGGIPVYQNISGQLSGIEAVIDKDLCAALLARTLQADILLIATDVDGVYIDWGQPSQKRIAQTYPEALKQFDFATGSMQPKVQAAIEFVQATGKKAMIGSLSHIADMLNGAQGTTITLAGKETVYYSD